MSIFATGSFELKGGGSPTNLIITASHVSAGPRIGVDMAAAPNTTFAIGGDLGLTDDATNTRFSVTNTNAYINVGTDTNNRGFMLWENGSTRLRFGTKQGGSAYFSSLILKDGNVGIGGEPTTDLQVHGGDVMVGDGALGVAAKVNFGNASTYIERPSGSSTWRFQTDRPVIFDTGGAYSLYANSFTFKNANESKKIWSVSQTQDLADSTEQTKVWVHEDDADAVFLLKDATAETYEVSNGTEVLKLRGTQGTGAERMSTIVTGSGNLHVRWGAHITGSIYLRSTSTIKAASSTISFSTTTTNISGELQVSGNEIKASDGGDVIHWDTSDNVQIGNLGSTTGTLQINGNEIKKNGGTTMIDFPAVTGDPTRLSGDLQINGNKIKNSATAEVINLGALAGDPVIISKDLRVGGNDIQDSGANVTLGFDGSGNINEIGPITTALTVNADATVAGDGSGGTTVYLGNQVEEDLRLLLRGNEKFGYIGLDDSLNKLVLGEGTTVGSSAHISMNLNADDLSKRTEVTGSLELTRGITTGLVVESTNTFNGMVVVNGATTINDDYLTLKAADTEDAKIQLWADNGDDNIDKWQIQAGASSPWFSIQTHADGLSYKSFIDLKSDATAANRKMDVTGSIGLTTGKIRVDAENLELLAATNSSASDAAAQAAGARITMNADGEVGIGTTPATGYVLATKSAGGSLDDRKCLIGGDLYVDGALNSTGDVKALSGLIDGPASGDLTIRSEAGIIIQLDHDADTSNTFSIVAGSGTERLSLDEGGDLQIDGDLTVSGNDIKDSGENVVISMDGAGALDDTLRIAGSDVNKISLEHSSTSGGNGPELNFRRIDTGDVDDGENLGEIWFRGSNDAITFLQSAAILGEADGAWTHNTASPGKLTFFTTPAGSTTVTERMCITSAGRIGHGQTNPSYHFQSVGLADTSFIGSFTNTSTNADADILRLKYSNIADPGTDNRIIACFDSAGDHIYSVKGNGSGGSSVATTFTAGHDTVVERSVNVVPGMILESTGEIWYKPTHITYETALPKCALATTNGSKTVFGVVAGYPTTETGEYIHNGFLMRPAFEGYARRAGVGDDEWNIGTMSLGEGVVWVTNINGDIENGDFIESSVVTGYGRKQDDDILRSKTVAKCTESIDWSSVTDTIVHNGTEYKKVLIACTYHCG